MTTLAHEQVTIYQRTFGVLVCEGRRESKAIKASLQDVVNYYKSKGYKVEVK